ncbi:MAG: co-chaperone GroES [Gammaproteobacteria bacterium]|nr:co-chaperone GroES [Gammaproteobacteria bacterium]
MSSKINPLGPWVVAEAVEAQSKTASGLYIPEGAKEKSKVAKVAAVGSDVKNVKPNDEIIYKEYSTTEVKVDGTEYILVEEKDVLGTLK